MEGVDPYKVFGLARDFSAEALRKRFKELVLKHHPDSNTDVSASPMVQIITGCYKMLAKDLEKRIMLCEPPRIPPPPVPLPPRPHQSHSSSDTSSERSKKNKFDLEKFNRVFAELKMKEATDEGYEDWMNDPESFDSKHDTSKIKYHEPAPLMSAAKSLGNCYELGTSKIADYSGANMTAKNLNYMDYKTAYTTHTLVDERVVDKRKEYQGIDDIKADRANITFTMSEKDRRKHEMLEQRKKQEDLMRMQALARRDDDMFKQRTIADKLMLGGSS